MIVVVSKNHFGEIYGIYVFMQHSDICTVAEAFVILSYQSYLCWSNVCFKSDAKVIIQNLNNPKKPFCALFY